MQIAEGYIKHKLTCGTSSRAGHRGGSDTGQNPTWSAVLKRKPHSLSLYACGQAGGWAGAGGSSGRAGRQAGRQVGEWAAVRAAASLPSSCNCF